jgi:predicted alpha/beta-hydrolase family hydrolase
VFFGYAVDTCRSAAFVGENDFDCLGYPFFPADKPVKMLEPVLFVMFRLYSETVLCFGHIGHTS